MKRLVAGSRLRTALSSALIGGGILLGANHGHASPSYPGAIQSALGLDCPPRCTLCHQDRQGGEGTVRSSTFGETLITVAELGGDDEATLRCALELLEPGCESAPACALPGQTCLPADTDGDGVGDIDELRMTRDPNVDGEGLLCGAAYGCGAHLAPADTAWAPWLSGIPGVALIVAIYVRRRRLARG
jgi:hypothetical protein